MTIEQRSERVCRRLVQDIVPIKALRRDFAKPLGNRCGHFCSRTTHQKLFFGARRVGVGSPSHRFFANATREILLRYSIPVVGSIFCKEGSPALPLSPAAQETHMNGRLNETVSARNYE